MKGISLAIVLALAASPAAAQLVVPVDVSITGDRVTAAVRAPILPLPVDAELILEFPEATGLTAANLGISARLVNPLDPSFRARLPSGGLAGIPLALPLVIRVEPPTTSDFAFSNAARVELHTHLLPYTVDSPLRLYKAPLGGQFYDITDEVASGSIRTRGRTGDFSEFLVLLDLFPRPQSAELKYEYLEERLAGATVSPVARAALETELAESRADFDAGNIAGAIADLDEFVDVVETYAGAGIPNRWRAARDLDNVAGDLLGEAGALRYTLTRID